MAAAKEVSQGGDTARLPVQHPQPPFTPQSSWIPSVTHPSQCPPAEPRAAASCMQHLPRVPQQGMGCSPPRVTSAPSPAPGWLHTGSPKGGVTRAFPGSDMSGGQSLGSAAAPAPGGGISRARGAKGTVQLCKEPIMPWTGQGVIKSFQHSQAWSPPLLPGPPAAAPQTDPVLPSPSPGG